MLLFILPGLVYSFSFLFHTVVVLTQFLVAVCEFLEYPCDHYLNSISDSLLNSISLSSFSGESSIPFDCMFFFCLPISGSSFCLFLCFLMFRVASCLCRVNFYGRNFMGFSGVVSLFSLSGCSRFSLSSVSVGSLVVPGFLPFGGFFVGGFSSTTGILMFAAPTYSCMWDQWQRIGKVD